MKEDYLWDKTGSDSEIEKLENSLKEFRSTSSIAPKLPQKTFTFDNDSLQNETPKRFSFRFAFATFACLGLAVISVGLFQVLNTGEQNLVQTQFQNISDKPNISGKPKAGKPAVIESPPIFDVTSKKENTQPKVAVTKFTSKPKTKVKRLVKAKKQVQTKIKRNPIIAKKVKPKAINSEPKVKTVTLTKEEKEAYETLMQALSVTGSQMRIVQEGINGVEEKPVVKKGKR